MSQISINFTEKLISASTENFFNKLTVEMTDPVPWQTRTD
jgi:hypothetical protein